MAVVRSCDDRRPTVVRAVHPIALFVHAVLFNPKACQVITAVGAPAPTHGKHPPI
jgi:hypothetical protein